MDELLRIWDDILLSIQEEYAIPNTSFKAFLKPLEPYSLEGSSLTVLFSDESDERALNYITKKYSTSIKVKIAEMLDKDYDISFILANDAVSFSSTNKDNEEKIISNDYNKTNLNQKFTFESFVVGDSNKFAYNASLAVAETPGGAFNPLYIYGGPGLGKTHLMHSIGNFIINEHPNHKVLYVTSEVFVNEVINSIRNTKNSETADSMSKFRDKYRSVDVLMIDDIQFIIGKESTQNEFFQTFNALHQLEKQIIISSDRPPKDMEILEERITSRFAGGLLTEIGRADYETRMAILRQKSDQGNIKISDDILDYIAVNIDSNIRELEGALNKIIAYITLGKTEITLDVAKKELSSYIYSKKQKEITPQTIIEIVASYYNISIDQMCSTRRTREIAEPRQIAMYLCKEMTDYPLQAIGTFLGGKDHSTVIHGVNKIGDMYKEDENFRHEINNIKNKITD